MTISTLDARPALLVVDLQKGIVGLPTAHPMADVVQPCRRDWPTPFAATTCRSSSSMSMAERRAAPSNPVAVTEFPAGWTDLIPELNRQPSDHVVTKRTWGAFTNTDLETYLKQSGVTQVVIAGVATSAGVEFDRASRP